MGQRWAAFSIVIGLMVALVVGLLIRPTASQHNIEDGAWFASYFANTELEGDPALTRYERNLSYNWSEDAPLGLPQDNFSARWEGEFDFTAGTWRFIVGADDGVRLWLDDVLIIDQWEAGDEFISYSADQFLSAGTHLLRLEYYEQTGLAGIDVKWQLVPTQAVASATPATNVAPPTPTPLPRTDVLGTIATGSLDIYDGPGVQYGRMGQVFLYQTFPVIGKNNDGSWLLLDLGNGRTGWVNGRFVIKDREVVLLTIAGSTTTQLAEVRATATQNTSFRAGPSARHTSLDLINLTDEMIVLGRSSDSLWYLVQYRGIDGWVFAPHVQLISGVPLDLPFVQ